MKNTWLIQRLKKPFKSAGGPLDKLSRAFVFGGGGGRISDKLWALLDPILRFDYMGAAEYEWGEVPEAFGKMRDYALADQLKAFTITIPRSDIKPTALPPWAKKDKAECVPSRTDDPVVYVLCRAEHCEEVEQRLRMLARDELRIRDGSRFSSALDPKTKGDTEVVGWLELDNGFFFSIDEAMAEGVAQLYGCSFEQPVAAAGCASPESD